MTGKHMAVSTTPAPDPSAASFHSLWASQDPKLHRQTSAIPTSPELTCLNFGSKRSWGFLNLVYVYWVPTPCQVLSYLLGKSRKWNNKNANPREPTLSQHLPIALWEERARASCLCHRLRKTSRRFFWLEVSPGFRQPIINRDLVTGVHLLTLF